MSAGAGHHNEFLRWGLAFAAALLAHGALAAVLLTRTPPPADALPSDAVILDLDPDPSETQRPDDVAGPEVTESVDPPPEPETASEAEPPAPDSPPPQLAETKPPSETAPPELTAPPTPSLQAEAVLPPTPEKPPEPKTREEAEVKPEPKPLEKQPEAKEERRTAPSQARAASAAALGGGGRPSAAALATWSAKLGVHLAQHKRYPSEARARRQQGTALVRITLDGGGRVLSRTLVKASGAAPLDQESMAMLLRAQPLPKPPANMPLPVTLTIPVRFSIH